MTISILVLQMSVFLITTSSLAPFTAKLSISSSLRNMITNRLPETAQAIEFIYDDRHYANPDASDKFQLRENEILIDYTDGNRSMTAGALLAGADPQRRVEYIHNEYDDDGNINHATTVMMKVDISYRVKPVDRVQ